MRVSRVFSGVELRANQSVALDQRCTHYLLNVLRLRDGAELVLFDGSGFDYDAKLSVPARNKVVAVLAAARQIDLESPLHTTLALGIGKGERMDWATQKATELGANHIQPLWTARVEVKLQGDRLARKHAHWQQVAISACEQCGRSRLPDVAAPLQLSAWLETLPELDEAREARFVMHPEGSSLAALAPVLPAPRRALLLIGPEGGFNDDELAAARRAGFHLLQLGPRVLRTETAPVVGLGLMQQFWGDFRL